jgi:hypothetical protein
VLQAGGLKLSYTNKILNTIFRPPVKLKKE